MNRFRNFVCFFILLLGLYPLGLVYAQEESFEFDDSEEIQALDSLFEKIFRAKNGLSADERLESDLFLDHTIAIAPISMQFEMEEIDEARALFEEYFEMEPKEVEAFLQSASIPVTDSDRGLLLKLQSAEAPGEQTATDFPDPAEAASPPEGLSLLLAAIAEGKETKGEAGDETEDDQAKPLEKEQAMVFGEWNDFDRFEEVVTRFPARIIQVSADADALARLTERSGSYSDAQWKHLIEASPETMSALLETEAFQKALGEKRVKDILESLEESAQFKLHSAIADGPNSEEPSGQRILALTVTLRGCIKALKGE